MESIAAERLNKIGKNPQLVSQREDLETDLQAVNELLQAQEELDYGENSNCDIGHGTHSDHGQLNVTTKSSGGLFRVKSESCFRLSLVPSMIKPAAIAGAGGGPSSAAGGGGSAAGDGNTTSGASRDGDQPSNPAGAGAASGAVSGVSQSKSSFNLHNLLR